MSKKKRTKRKQKQSDSNSFPSNMWMDDDGIHALTPEPLSSLDLELMSLRFQEKIRNSPMWDQMVKEYGEEEAEKILKNCRAKPG